GRRGYYGACATGPNAVAGGHPGHCAIFTHLDGRISGPFPGNRCREGLRMRPSWYPDIRTTWHLLAMVMGLLLLLTYLLFQSRTPAPPYDTRFHEALQEIALHEVRLTRDVLLARAGLLPHADSLVQTRRALLHALATLRPGSAEPSEDMAMALRQQVDLLTT